MRCTMLVAIAVLLAGCSGPTAATPGPTATPTVAPSAHPSATPRPYAIAVTTSDARTIVFLAGDGRTLGQTSFPSPTFGLTTAAGQLWYVDQDKHLRAVGVDGRVSDLGVLQGLAAAGATAFGLAVSGDGRRWAWGECSNCLGAGGRARLYVGGVDAHEQLVLDDPTSNAVLVPLAFTARGIIVARSATGLGGCCYFTPESGHRDVLLVDSATLQLSRTWNGCAAASPSPSGAFACVGGTVTVNLPDGSTRSVIPTQPVRNVGWALVDDAGGRVVFGVVHSRGQGDGGCPCVIDTEVGGLDGGTVTKLVDQMTPDDLLPDGRVVATSTPSTPVLAGQGTVADWIVSPDATRVRLGPEGARFLAVLTLP